MRNSEALTRPSPKTQKRRKDANRRLHAQAGSEERKALKRLTLVVSNNKNRLPAKRNSKLPSPSGCVHSSERVGLVGSIMTFLKLT